MVFYPSWDSGTAEIFFVLACNSIALVRSRSSHAKLFWPGTDWLILLWLIDWLIDWQYFSKLRAIKGTGKNTFNKWSLFVGDHCYSCHIVNFVFTPTQWIQSLQYDSVLTCTNLNSIQLFTKVEIFLFNNQNYPQEIVFPRTPKIWNILYRQAN